MGVEVPTLKHVGIFEGEMFHACNGVGEVPSRERIHIPTGEVGKIIDSKVNWEGIC